MKIDEFLIGVNVRTPEEAEAAIERMGLTPADGRTISICPSSKPWKPLYVSEEYKEMLNKKKECMNEDKLSLALKAVVEAVRELMPASKFDLVKSATNVNCIVAEVANRLNDTKAMDEETRVELLKPLVAKISNTGGAIGVNTFNFLYALYNVQVITARKAIEESEGDDEGSIDSVATLLRRFPRTDSAEKVNAVKEFAGMALLIPDVTGSEVVQGKLEGLFYRAKQIREFLAGDYSNLGKGFGCGTPRDVALKALIGKFFKSFTTVDSQLKALNAVVKVAKNQ